MSYLIMMILINLYSTTNDLHLILQKVINSSFDGWQLFYSVVSGGVAVGAFWWLDLKRINAERLYKDKQERQYYENLIIFILAELRYSFDMITNPSCITSSPNLPLILKFTNWDENKPQLAHYLSPDLTSNLEYNFDSGAESAF
jgi:hypothetical protein